MSLAQTILRFSRAARRRALTGADKSDDLKLASVSYFLEAAKYRLKPDRLVQIINDADAGDPREQAALFPTLLEKEPILAAHLNTRRLAALSKPWRVQSEGQPEVAEEITRMLAGAGLQNHGLAPGGPAIRRGGGQPRAARRSRASGRFRTTAGSSTRRQPAASAARQPIPMSSPRANPVLVNDGAAGLPCAWG